MTERMVLQNVKLVNKEKIDIVINDGRLIEITAPGHGIGEQVINLSGHYVSSGWIDLHVHAFPEFDPYGDEIDEIGIKQGVTTIVDAGSCGADRIADLVGNGKESKTNLLAFLNISKIGLQRVDELSNLDWIDREKVIQAVQQYPDEIVGLKARVSRSVVGGNGIEPLHIAEQLSKDTSLPLMVHIGSAPPKIEEVLALLKEGDVMTHYLNGKTNNLFDEKGAPLPEFLEAIQRGIHLDVGHGTASFSFQIAEAAKRYDIGLDTISTDIYRGNRVNGPVFSMANVLSKFLYLGYSLEEVIAAVTNHAARWLKKPELGRIQVGDSANLTIFTVQNKPIELVDSEGEKRTSDKRIETKGVVVNGEFIEC
ncbi:amidohydrolase/deacetylase family metallohydrolase [Lederbergia sp. NSJ-179]|uniref:amidohydrolase/deacetylase family metallohydrolase n=1 Tax=Lederbergia sp. NSJ-179 TaxID=2931402 RepID=UPI001FD467E5|nr:amidohydrolase/deacetylase family metallohydrolase [Lederbergia sp. NSJ-179]MCJ7841336.1 amidohydrolase/deacetylase family metallohydrolase [Lederbergia sp. NSJ-179]